MDRWLNEMLRLNESHRPTLGTLGLTTSEKDKESKVRMPSGFHPGVGVGAGGLNLSIPCGTRGSPLSWFYILGFWKWKSIPKKL